MVGEHRLPHTRSELDDALCRVLADALQDIDEVGVGIHALEPAGHEETLDDADALGAELRPREQPVASPGGNRTQAALDNHFMPTLRPKPLTDRAAPLGLSA